MLIHDSSILFFSVLTSNLEIKNESKKKILQSAVLQISSNFWKTDALKNIFNVLFGLVYSIFYKTFKKTRNKKCAERLLTCVKDLNIINQQKI